jgi:hypothetical protein
LNTSQGFQPAYKFSTQPGGLGYDPDSQNQLWSPGDIGYDGANRYRNSLARYFLPTVDELHKAAYYDPAMNAGAGGYWDFPTGSDTAPTPVASGTAAATAVYGQSSSQGPADITAAGGLSPYGVMAIGGNVYEMEETESDFGNDLSSTRRGARGGSWASPFPVPNFLRSTLRQSVEFDGLTSDVGFRVASRVDLPGDYNGDGKVNAADYVLFRNDPPAFGGITLGYNTWRANFGNPPGSGSGLGSDAGSVPEPASALMLVSTMVGAAVARRRR